MIKSLTEETEFLQKYRQRHFCIAILDSAVNVYTTVVPGKSSLMYPYSGTITSTIVPVLGVQDDSCANPEIVLVALSVKLKLNSITDLLLFASLMMMLVLSIGIYGL